MRYVVTLTYVDTSAAMKLIVDEAESDVLARGLAHDRRLVSSWLLHTELHCAAGRHPEAVPATTVNAVLATIDLIDVTRGDLISAGTHVPLRSHDALHLASALRVAVDEITTYNAELTDAACRAGLVVFAPS